MLKPISLLLFIALIAFFQTGCDLANGQKKNSAVKEFEGVITYHENVWSIDSSLNANDTVQLYYSHGKYVNEHLGRYSNIHDIKDYYFGNEPLRLFLVNNSDSLFQLDLNAPEEQLLSFNRKKIAEKTLGRDCESIEIRTAFIQKQGISYTDYTFVFSRGYLPVDKDNFKNWKLGFRNKFTDEAGVLYLKFKALHFDSTHSKVLSSKSYDIISAKEQPVAPAMFEIDRSKIRRNE